MKMKHKRAELSAATMKRIDKRLEVVEGKPVTIPDELAAKVKEERSWVSDKSSLAEIQGIARDRGIILTKSGKTKDINKTKAELLKELA